MTIIYRKTIDQLEIGAHAVWVVDEALRELISGTSLAEHQDKMVFVEAGEHLKTLAAVEALAASVLKIRATRPLILVAVGGGTVGDAVGFLASILWRGVELWHVPTTLLAMVDSAHGGKTAVNLGEAKNQLGTFYPAGQIILVEEFLAYLPLTARQDGLFELIKALWLGDTAALDILEAEGGVEALGYAPFSSVAGRLKTLLLRAISVKERIVAEDPFEQKGLRTILNFGHTLGHALELVCGISHGQAVGWGMLAAAEISEARAGLSPINRRRLQSHLWSLLRYHPALVELVQRRQFEALHEAMAKDKKRKDGQLRSVLLGEPGEDEKTAQNNQGAENREINARVCVVEAKVWTRAFERVMAHWLGSAARVRAPRARAGGADQSKIRHEIRPGASKSELNRARIIQSLHAQEVVIEADSRASDVYTLERAMARLKGARHHEELRIWAGEGGTTFRFLLARAAMRAGVTRIYAHPRLLERPHEPLIEALVRGGAQIEAIEASRASFQENLAFFQDNIAEESAGESRQSGAPKIVGYRVRGWQEFPKNFRVDCTKSSQFASAIALLAAAGEPFGLELCALTSIDESSIDGSNFKMKSAPYFDMTLAMLRDVGVQIRRMNSGETTKKESCGADRLEVKCAYEFHPGDDYGCSHRLRIAADASSEAVWRVARSLGVQVDIRRVDELGISSGNLQPDSRVDDYLKMLCAPAQSGRDGLGDDGLRDESSEGTGPLEPVDMDLIAMDLSEAPDLVPILCVAALFSPAAVEISGVGHLRHKESNRIEDLGDSFERAGITLHARRDGIGVPAGVQRARSGSMICVQGDHRLAMAALLLSLSCEELLVDSPWAVAKSYPDFWHDARALGWRVEFANKFSEI